VVVRDGRPLVDRIETTFPDGARDFGRELAISELEAAVNDLDRHQTLRSSGEPFPILTLSGFPLGVALRGSRGRRPSRSDRDLATLIDALEHGRPLNLSRRRIRELAATATTKGLAEPIPGSRPRRWQLTLHGQALLANPD
jgi:hypothetical protein